MKYSYFTYLLLTLTFISCSREEFSSDFNNDMDVNLTEISQESLLEKTLLNVSYGDHPQQVFDIYLPQNRTMLDTKVIMIIHGGSWVNGDKNGLTSFALDLKEKNPNHAIVNINYVLGSETQYAFPNQFFDLAKVINFIKEKKNEYHIKPEFGLLGSSAGGHLALQYTYKYDVEKDIQFVGSLGGPTNFLDPHYQEASTELINLLVDKDYYNSTSLGTQITHEIDYLKKLSPTFEVSTSSRPTILFYGDEDAVVPLSNGIILNTYLKQSSVEKNLNIYEGGHGGWKSEAQYEITNFKLKEFINTHLYVSEK